MRLFPMEPVMWMLSVIVKAIVKSLSECAVSKDVKNAVFAPKESGLAFPEFNPISTGKS